MWLFMGGAVKASLPVLGISDPETFWKEVKKIYRSEMDLLPVPLVGWILGRVYQSSFGDRFMYRHSMKAPDEMRQLHGQFYRWIDQGSKESV